MFGLEKSGNTDQPDQETPPNIFPFGNLQNKSFAKPSENTLYLRLFLIAGLIDAINLIPFFSNSYVNLLISGNRLSLMVNTRYHQYQDG